MNLSNTSFSFFLEILDNAVLSWALIACGLAQLSKLLIEFLLHRKWRPSVIFETGGMPSSHSALVTSSAAGVGLQLGFDHPGFAIAATFAFVVMYDASGIRRAAGLTAARVNALHTESGPSSMSQPLKESLGHSRLEVLVGSFLGPVIAVPGITFLGSPLHLAQMLGLIVG